MKKENEVIDEENGVSMNVFPSSISSVDSGIARINEEHIKELGNEEHQLVRIRSEKTTITSKLFGDKLVPKGQVVLREGDMKELDVEQGDMVILLPYTTIKEEISSSWDNFTRKVKGSIKSTMEVDK